MEPLDDKMRRNFDAGLLTFPRGILPAKYNDVGKGVVIFLVIMFGG